MTTLKPKLRVGLVVPHIFMHRDILPRVIFSPGELALQLTADLEHIGAKVTLFTPGPVDTAVPNVTADLSGFEAELTARGDTYLDLIKKHPLTFTTLARQVQAELISHAYEMANHDELDVVHIYTNEEELACTFAHLCTKPVVFTHHDPFNFLVKYRSVFPKYKHLNWLSMSYAQRSTMPTDTNWRGNIYHGLPADRLRPVLSPSRDYLAYLGRIIEPKGVHLAIEAVRQYNQSAARPLTLRIAGKHYAGSGKDSYWQSRIVPNLGDHIEYVGFIDSPDAKRGFLGNAAALIVPSTFYEPFGMVSIEALACATPVIGLNIGATPEVITSGTTGVICEAAYTTIDGKQRIDDTTTASHIVRALTLIKDIDPAACRHAFTERFDSKRMAEQHLEVYRELIAGV